MNQFLASVVFIVLTGFRCDAKAADTIPPPPTAVSKNSSMKLFLDTATKEINDNTLSIIRVEKIALENKNNLKALEDRIVTLEQPKLNEGASTSTATPEVPRAEPPASKPSIVKRIGKTILEFSLFKGLIYLIGK